MMTLEVSGIMVKNVVTFTVKDSVEKIAKEMTKKNISCVVIIDKKGKPISVITERDLLKKIVSKGITIKGLIAKNIMSDGLITVQGNENVFRAAALMEKKKIRRLPVVDKTGKLIGLVTETDIVKSLTNVAKYLNDKLIEYITTA
ncbi:CBS domain-containing protein [Candidatus Woesearchaeota archaeon]|nr:MAG: CBS domain-containing protein [Candidatus Woesearchaeota archaeon]